MNNRNIKQSIQIDSEYPIFVSNKTGKNIENLDIM